MKSTYLILVALLATSISQIVFAQGSSSSMPKSNPPTKASSQAPNKNTPSFKPVAMPGENYGQWGYYRFVQERDSIRRAALNDSLRTSSPILDGKESATDSKTPKSDIPVKAHSVVADSGSLNGKTGTNLNGSAPQKLEQPSKKIPRTSKGGN